MTNNDVLRRLRYALDVSDREVVALYAHAGYDIRPGELDALFMKDDQAGFVECDDVMVEFFLRGLIVSRRGKREGEPASVASRGGHLSNNDILKQLRIALEYRDEDIVEVLKLGGMNVTKSELGALFRKKDHQNYRPCGDQFLRYFLNGLTVRLKKAPSANA